MIYVCRNGAIINFKRFAKVYCGKVFFKDALQLKQPLFEVYVVFDDHPYEIEEFKTEENAKSFMNWLATVVLLNNGQVFNFGDFTDGGNND
jgi:hypothetical protein